MVSASRRPLAQAWSGCINLEALTATSRHRTKAHPRYTTEAMESGRCLPGGAGGGTCAGAALAPTPLGKKTARQKRRGSGH
eukprot:15055001-Alexandrium_andersonii.AAC.1